MFSGATQFTTIGLVAAGAGAPAILATVALLNVRHLMMGAVLRSSLGQSRLKRALLAWFLLDESFGFTMVAASRTPSGEGRIQVAERTSAGHRPVLLRVWLAGTALGILGAGVQGLEDVAVALFPVLFIALAALTARTLSLAARALMAAGITAVIAFTLPQWSALAPVVAGLLVAIPNDPARRVGPMTPLLLGAVAAITYGSRLAAMAVLPRPSGRIETTLERVVPAIFASIATLSLITDQPALGGGTDPAGGRRRPAGCAASLVRPLPGGRAGRLLGGGARLLDEHAAVRLSTAPTMTGSLVGASTRSASTVTAKVWKPDRSCSTGTTATPASSGSNAPTSTGTPSGPISQSTYSSFASRALASVTTNEAPAPAVSTT